MNYENSGIGKFVGALGSTKNDLIHCGRSKIIGISWLCTNIDRNLLPLENVQLDPYIRHGDINIISSENLANNIIERIIYKVKISEIRSRGNAKDPLDWQIDAIRIMYNKGKKYRCQIVMPTGTGKTLLIPIFVSEYGIRFFVVFEPKKAAVQQNLDRMMDQLCNYNTAEIRKRNNIKGLKVLIITSDKNIDYHNKYDYNRINTTCTNDYQQIQDWISDAKNDLSSDKKYIYGIFSTYHQQSKVVRAFVNNDYMPEMVCCDEAHEALVNKRISDIMYDVDDDGDNSDDDMYMSSIKYSAVLHTDFDPKYMFFTTATPEKSKDHLTLTSMEDEALFGKIGYSMSLYDAIHVEKLLCNYDITTLSADEYDIEFSKNLKYDTRKCQIYIYTKLVYQLVKNGTSNKCIVFLKKEKEVKFFKKHFDKLIKDDDDIFIAMITYKISNNERNRIQEKFEKSKRAILLNIKICISAIDIPCIDGIFYGTPMPRDSNIVQSLGRGLRKDPNNSNKLLHIFVPFISVTPDNNLQEILDVSDNYGKMCGIILGLNNSDNIYENFLTYKKGGLGVKTNISLMQISGISSNQTTISTLTTKESKLILDTIFKSYHTYVWNKLGIRKLGKLRKNYKHYVLNRIIIAHDKKGYFSHRQITKENIEQYKQPFGLIGETPSNTASRDFSAGDENNGVISKREKNGARLMYKSKEMWRLRYPLPSVKKMGKFDDVRFVKDVLVPVSWLLQSLPPKPLDFEVGTRIETIYKRYHKILNRIKSDYYSPDDARTIIETLPEYFTE